ncbi:beta-phosphoglucomutase [Tindallia californiensis]|uniref:Beta-phosphoglucomutase n=1 Tax=Tindallia californiensis TaxID=159292 RepID=A0A1H3I5J2_9FIRM|nr:beta-phosphoglucomutase [Tindallia californiensis]SDY22960.1 beta-phosphoglucomutase [Tindallia californiensis]
MIKGLIFDLDGVIVDTAKYHYFAWKKLAEELNFDFDENQNEALKGVSRMQALELLLNFGSIQANQEEKTLWANRKNRYYQQCLSNLSQNDLLPGVLNFLIKAKERKYKIALASSSKNAKTILYHLNLENYFDYIADGNMVQESKPDPEIFLLASDGIQCSPNSCLVFEDALSGIQAAKSAGMLVIGVGKSTVLTTADLVISGFNNFKLNEAEAYFNNDSSVSG